MPLFQGFATHAAGAELLPYKYDPGEIKPNEVEIAISHCGICRSDIHMVDNDWGISHYPLIPGHEIVGKVTITGSAVLGLNSGDRVGVGWQANSCGHCEWCLQGEENLCADSQGTCVHRNGGYADRVRVNARFVVPIPDGLESERAAPLLCGGITVYAPIRSHGVNPASRVGHCRHRRSGAHGGAVCPCFWSGGYGVFQFSGQRGGRALAGRRPLREHAGNQDPQEACRPLRLHPVDD